MTHTSPVHTIENFDSCFQVIASFLDALQKNFKEDTHYSYPLMPAQANTMYVLDEDVAAKMRTYMSALIKDVCGFEESEFKFTGRGSRDEAGLYKLRLEFVDGITFEMIRRLLETTTLLEDRVLQRKMAQ